MAEWKLGIKAGSDDILLNPDDIPDLDDWDKWKSEGKTDDEGPRFNKEDLPNIDDLNLLDDNSFPDPPATEEISIISKPSKPAIKSSKKIPTKPLRLEVITTHLSCKNLVIEARKQMNNLELSCSAIYNINI